MAGFKEKLIEDILIILAIFSLWPTILGWQAVIYKIIQFLALAVLVIILIRRLSRVRGSNE